MPAAPEILADIKTQAATIARLLGELRLLGIVFPEIGLAETGANLISAGAGFAETRMAGNAIDIQAVRDSYSKAHNALAEMNAHNGNGKNPPA